MVNDTWEKRIDELADLIKDCASRGELGGDMTEEDESVLQDACDDSGDWSCCATSEFVVERKMDDAPHDPMIYQLGLEFHARIQDAFELSVFEKYGDAALHSLDLAKEAYKKMKERARYLSDGGRESPRCQRCKLAPVVIMKETEDRSLDTSSIKDVLYADGIAFKDASYNEVTNTFLCGRCKGNFERNLR